MSQQSIEDLMEVVYRLGVNHGLGRKLYEEKEISNLPEAQSALLELILSCIGEDEPFKFKNGNAIPMIVEEAWKNGRNQLRAEIKQAVKDKFNAK